VPVADRAVGLGLNMCELNIVNRLSLLFLRTVTRFLEFYFPKTKSHRSVFKKCILKIIIGIQCYRISVVYIACSATVSRLFILLRVLPYIGYLCCLQCYRISVVYIA